MRERRRFVGGARKRRPRDRLFSRRRRERRERRREKGFAAGKPPLALRGARGHVSASPRRRVRAGQVPPRRALARGGLQRAGFGGEEGGGDFLAAPRVVRVGHVRRSALGAWCAPPTFDARRVAAVCGVEYDEPKSVSPESVSPERLSIVSRSSPSSSSSLGADAKEPKGETSANANQRERARPKKTDATAGNDDEPRDEPGRPSANRAPSGDSSSKSPDEKELSSSDKSEKSDASLDDAARQKRAETTKPMTREEQKARAAARAAALRSKSEPLLSDDTATRAEMALVEKEVEGREAVSSGSRSTPGVDASGPDLFASDPAPPRLWRRARGRNAGRAFSSSARRTRWRTCCSATATRVSRRSAFPGRSSS